MSVAAQRVSQVTTVALEMALPAAGGYWLDQKFGTEPWLVSVGALLGFATAMMHLLRMNSAGKTRSRGRDGDRAR